ncbi:MAG: SPFH domain-containing protein [Nitrospinae bacterium]|nr:SPFH domain-containing protein [Nitrospinota bacterium]
MGIFDKFKGEFVDIIEWLDDSRDTMAWRFDRYQNEIKQGAKLTVRETQVAIFVNEGQVADVFTPGLYTIETKNIPLLTTLKGWPYGFNSPFKAEVYFLNTRTFTDLKWGTKNPIMLRDKEFGPIRIRAFGSYTIKVDDPLILLKEIVGTDGHFTTNEISEQLKNLIITRFSDSIAESGIPVLDIASQYDELSLFIQEKIAPEFKEYGISVNKFLIENVSVPEEVEKALDKRSQMGILGNLNNFTQFQAATSMEAAANNPGGTAAGGMGLGMGFAMANQMGQAFTQNPSTGSPPPPPPPSQTLYYTVENGQQQGPFSLDQLRQMAQSGTLQQETLVWCNGMSGWSPAKDVSEMQKLFSTPPPSPPPPPIP